MPESPLSPEKAVTETRERLLNAAERLFAQHGIDSVSMRQINREAGQKNTSSIHYYFGSREAIIEAVIERRMSAINTRRMRLIEELEAAGRQGELAELVAAYVRPLATQPGTGNGSNAYVRFLAQAYASSGIDVLKIARGRWDQSLVDLVRLISACLPEIPRNVVRERILNFFRIVVYVLADRERDILTGRTSRNRMPLDAQVEDLISTQASALAAPHRMSGRQDRR
ncbi:MAG: TetR family transcriptional regulator [Hyphomicrobiaceae bacterium]